VIHKGCAQVVFDKFMRPLTSAIYATWLGNREQISADTCFTGYIITHALHGSTRGFVILADANGAGHIRERELSMEIIFICYWHYNKKIIQFLEETYGFSLPLPLYQPPTVAGE
jgi:hypothetical protein